MNKYYLLIDAGNSLCKIELFNSENDQFILSAKLKYSEVECFFKNTLQQYGITFILICSVKNKTDTDKIEQLCNLYWDDCHYVIFNNSDYKIIPSDYTYFESLGADRWISLLALHLQGKNNFCVIDCGTAITVDYVIDSVHLGGLIGPGLTALSTCLVNSTDQIKDIKQTDNMSSVSFTATSTIECISNGSFVYFTGFINSILDKNKQKYGDKFITYLTGGDHKQYQNINNYNIKHINNLVIDGLFHIKKLIDSKHQSTFVK